MEQMPFIYVFSKDDRDQMIREGFQLLKSDDAGDVYIFVAKQDMTFSLGDTSYVQSDILTF